MVYTLRFSSSKCSLFHNSNVFGSCIIHILYIYSTNIGTEYFKRGIYSPFFPLQNAVCFIILTCLVPVLLTFYIQDVLKLKKNNSGAKRLRHRNSLGIIIIIFLHGLGRLTCSGIDALPSFPGASTVSSSSRFVVEGVFRQSGVVRSFKGVDPVLFVFQSHVLYSRDLQSFPYDFASYFVQPCVSRNTS